MPQLRLEREQTQTRLQESEAEAQTRLQESEAGRLEAQTRLQESEAEKGRMVRAAIYTIFGQEKLKSSEMCIGFFFFFGGGGG